MDTGSSPVWPEIFGGGNIECIPNNMALARCLMCSLWLLFVHVMKSSIYTSMAVTAKVGISFCVHLQSYRNDSNG